MVCLSSDIPFTLGLLNTGNSFSCGVIKNYSDVFEAPVTIGCGIVNGANGNSDMYFTRDGKFLDYAYSNVQLNTGEFYPTIGLRGHPKISVEVNFGDAPFSFDVKTVLPYEEQVTPMEMTPFEPTEAHEKEAERDMCQSTFQHTDSPEEIIEDVISLVEIKIGMPLVVTEHFSPDMNDFVPAMHRVTGTCSSHIFRSKAKSELSSLSITLNRN